MKKIITQFPPFKENNIEEVKELLSKAFGNIENTTEIIVVHDCKNPRCPMGTLLGLLGTEEDEMIIADFIDSEIEKEKAEKKKIKQVLSKYPDTQIEHLSKNN